MADKHLRRVGKDCLISFEGSFYSLPAAQIRAGQRVVVQVHPEVHAGCGHAATGTMSSAGGTLVVHAQSSDGGAWLATHPRAGVKGSWVVEPAHYDGLPDGHTRTTTLDTSDTPAGSIGGPIDGHTTASSALSVRVTTRDPGPLAALIAANHAAGTHVATRPLADYAAAAAGNEARP